MTDQFELEMPGLPPAKPPRGTGPNSYVPIVKRILGEDATPKHERYKDEGRMARVLLNMGFKQKEILEVIDYINEHDAKTITSLRLLLWSNNKVMYDKLKSIANIPWSAPEMAVQKEEPPPVILAEDQRVARTEPPKPKRTLISFLSEWYNQ